ncbi:M13 family metallopeptidase [Roseateles sp. BYS180W]|uniref:M13 family metallopeptidase n=1 Tax=Roseateles rivi TaxID=3299028 RepID=A0ABW7FWY0_9BURK
MKILRLTTLAGAVALAALHLTDVQAAAPQPEHAHAHAQPVAGLEFSSFEPQVRAQDDLFRAVNGRWLKQTAIPADKAAWGAFMQLRDASDARVRHIAETLARTPQHSGSVEQKVGDFYQSIVNTAALDRAGLQPLKATLASIDAIGERQQLLAWIGRQTGQLDLPLLLTVDVDAKNPRQYTLMTWQGGLGLPERDYYLKTDDARFKQARAAYVRYLSVLARASGESNPGAAAQRVLALETRIAQAHWDVVALRDPVKTYNRWSTAELADKAPGVDWQLLLTQAGLGQLDSLVVSQPSYVTALAQLLAQEPLQDWKLYLRLRALDSAAPLLHKPLRDAHFAFHDKALTGATQPRPRWQYAVGALDSALGEAVGQIYVQRHFPPEAKARMLALVNQLLAAYKESIDGLSWMSPETKAQAQDKLSKYMVKIGYPDTWRDYSALQVVAGDALGNVERAARFEWQRVAARAGKPVDRSEWGMTPQTVNAYYNPALNEIVFPAAILQWPFFDMKADDAVNYGGIGAVIGHEISHGFDDQGSQYDGNGVLRNWWTDADRKAFEAVTTQLVAQYAAYEPLPGKHVNGQLTLGENIADLSGLQIAYKAYLRSLGGKVAPVIQGYSGEQRFFFGWSQVWREKERDERALQRLTADPHSPSQFRANGAAVNHDGFHQAFGTKPGDKMFKPSQQRIRIW